MEEKMAWETCCVVNATIDAIQKVVYGTGLLTPAIQADAAALMAGSVPIAWDDRWEGPAKPQAWLRGLAVRRSALSRWASKAGKGSGGLDKPLDLSDLFNPGTFLNALRQQTARELGCAMDTLKMASAWERGLLSGAAMTLELTGLLLQGVREGFDGQGLEEATPDPLSEGTTPAAL